VRSLVEELGATFVGASVLVVEPALDASDLEKFSAVLAWDPASAHFASASRRRVASAS
jgi:hypothetical protein